jgi:hypothetical protein
MPNYTYTDGMHTTTVTHRMLWSTAVVCATCGADMWRKPQAVTVLWGGMPPSGGELSLEIKQHMNNVDESRDKFSEEHEKHERETSED